MGTNTIGKVQKFALVPTGKPNVGEPSFEDTVGQDVGLSFFQSSRVAYISVSHPDAIDDTNLKTPFLKIQKAIDAMGEVADAAAEKLPRIFYIDGGIYDEALTLPQSGINIFIAIGPVVIGDGAGAVNASSTIARNVSVTLDNTKRINERPTYQFITMNRVEASTGDVAYGTSFMISGNFVLSDVNSQKGQFYFQGVKLQGNMDDSGLTADDRQDFYMSNCLVSGTFGTGKDVHIMEAFRCQFDGLIKIHKYGDITSSEIKGGITFSSGGGIDTGVPPAGFINTIMKGTFTGPAGSFLQMDSMSNRHFRDNTATLSVVTKKLMDRGYRSEVKTVTITANAFTPDMNQAGIFLTPTLTANVTVNNPVNALEGETLEIWFVQDATGSRTYTLGSEFKEGTTVKLTDLNTTLSKTHKALWNRRGTNWELLAVSNDL